MLAALEPFRQQVTDRSSRRGRRGRISHGAALADSLLELCRSHNSSEGDPLRPSPRVAIMVRVDAGALERGYTLPGERCEVDRVGPVPVGAVRRWMASGSTRVDAAIETGKGIYDICRVDRNGNLVCSGAGLHEFYAPGRADIPAKLEKALIARYPVCVVPGCGEMHDLQTDHVLAVEDGGPTTFYNLCRICAWHHVMKTHYRWVLHRRLGHWLWYSGGPPPRLEELQQELVPPWPGAGWCQGPAVTGGP